MRCPACGAEESGGGSCRQCGTPLPAGRAMPLLALALVVTVVLLVTWMWRSPEQTAGSREQNPAPTGVSAGNDCPVSPLEERPYGLDGFVAAGAQYEMEGLGSEPAGSYEATIFCDPHHVGGAVHLSGHRLDGAGVLGFRKHFTDEPVERLELTGVRGHADWPPHWGVVVSGAVPGCWVYRLESRTGVDHIVVEITEDDLD